MGRSGAQIAILGAALLLAAGAVFGTALNVPAEFPSIQVAAKAVAPGGTVSVVAGNNSIRTGAGDDISGGTLSDSQPGGPTEENALWLGVDLNSIYVRPGETCTVTLNQSSMNKASAGYQAFLTFDPAKLSLAPEAVITTTSPYGLNWLKTVNGPNIDLAAGVDRFNGQQLSSDDAKLAGLIFTVPMGTADSTTRIEFRAHDPASMFADEEGDAIVPVLIDSPTIYIDGTAPTGVNISADPASWTSGGVVTLTFSADDALSGIDHYEIAIDSEPFTTRTSPYMADVSSLADGVHTATVKAIDKAGNEQTASTSFYIDRTGPTVTITSVKQAGVELIGGGNALQGVVDLYVTVSDAHSGSTATPDVTVSPAGSSPETAMYVGKAGNTFHYRWTVTAATVNGAAVVNALVADISGNSGQAEPKTFNINKNQAGIVIELEGVHEPSVTRTIKLIVGGTGGEVPPVTLEREITFTSDGTANATGSITLTDLPTTGVWTRISAKDEQHTLRRTVDLVDLGNGQYAAQMTGENKLVGGDLTNDNIIDIRDFGVFSGQFGQSRLLNTTWPTRNADISCNGYIHSEDFSFVQVHFLMNGNAAPGSAEESGGGEGPSAVAVGSGDSAPMSSISVRDLAKIAGFQAAMSADINGDSMVDQTDVALFIRQFMNVRRGR